MEAGAGEEVGIVRAMIGPPAARRSALVGVGPGVLEGELLRWRGRAGRSVLSRLAACGFGGAPSRGPRRRFDHRNLIVRSQISARPGPRVTAKSPARRLRGGPRPRVR